MWGSLMRGLPVQSKISKTHYGRGVKNLKKRGDVLCERPHLKIFNTFGSQDHDMT